MGDILLYEIGHSCQGLDPDSGELVISSFDHAKERIDLVISQIIRGAKATDAVLYLTGKNNFRIDIAKRKGYKGQRVAEKPFHYYNLKAYLIHEYRAIVCEGYEADDAVCIAQYAALRTGEGTIICSRDKDVKQCPGWHYSWECGLQPEWGPYWVDPQEFGKLLPSYYPEGHKLAGQMKKLLGVGDKWFYAQLLMGDSVDNIPGIKGYGPAKVFKLLEHIDNEVDALGVAKVAYINAYGEIGNWQAELEEQAQLVWMVRERNPDGSLRMWRL